MSITYAINKLFSLRASFLVVGLTGRTGSGCTTSAKLLARGFTELPLNAVANPLSSPEQRKFRIIRAFGEKNWQPFTLISVTQAIASFVLSGEQTATEAFLRTHLPQSSVSSFLIEVERLRPLWESASTVLQVEIVANATKAELAKFFEFWNTEMTVFLTVARLAFTNNFAQVFQMMGDNLRSSGEVFSPEIGADKFYTLPERVGQIIVAARALDYKNEKSTRRYSRTSRAARP